MCLHYCDHRTVKYVEVFPWPCKNTKIPLPWLPIISRTRINDVGCYGAEYLSNKGSECEFGVIKVAYINYSPLSDYVSFRCHREAE